MRFLGENNQCKVISGYKCRPDEIHGEKRRMSLRKRQRTSERKEENLGSEGHRSQCEKVFKEKR